MKIKANAIVSNVETTTTSGGSMRLAIDFDADGIPHFGFYGAWSGKDIELIKRLLTREYHKNQRDIKRKGK